MEYQIKIKFALEEFNLKKHFLPLNTAAVQDMNRLHRAIHSSCCTKSQFKKLFPVNES